MTDKEDLKKNINEELSRYGLELSSVEKIIGIIQKWFEKNCSSFELSIDDPYLEIANRAVEHAVYAARDFIQKELDEKKLNFEKMEDTWESVLASFKMQGLREEKYVDVITDRHILGQNQNNFSVNEVLDEDEINSMYSETPKKTYSLSDQLFSTYIFRLLEGEKPGKRKNTYKGHDISMKDKIRTTILVLEYFGVYKTHPGVTSAEKDIEEKEAKFPVFKKLKEDIESIK